ncbi:unnamed protein product, partial [Linum tenue]
LQGKVALITGGASGIGAAAARLFAGNGAKVIIADVQFRIGPLRRRRNQLHLSPPRHLPPMRRQQRIRRPLRRRRRRFAPREAGHHVQQRRRHGEPNGFKITEQDSRDLDRVMGVNVFGAFFCAKHAARVMIPHAARVMIPEKSGVILFTASSVTTTFGNAPHAYTASKHAVVGLMKNLTVELGGYGIRVNSVSPDGVPTPMAMKAMGMDRKAVQELGSQRASLKGTMLDENDVAEAAMYLASEESKFVSGLNLVVDGGYNLKSA